MNEHFYNSIATKQEAEFTERSSKFIAIAFPLSSIEDFKQQLRSIKELHPKASHHCFAYRIGTDGLQYRSSDDGEPSGTAGKPILGQIDSKGITNVAIVVVRYFGGTLLGVPGLISAYKSAASLALQVSQTVQCPITQKITVQLPYSKMHVILDLLKRKNASFSILDEGLFTRLAADIPKQHYTEVINFLGNEDSVEIL